MKMRSSSSKHILKRYNAECHKGLVDRGKSPFLIVKKLQSVPRNSYDFTSELKQGWEWLNRVTRDEIILLDNNSWRNSCSLAKVTATSPFTYGKEIYKSVSRISRRLARNPLFLSIPSLIILKYFPLIPP